MHFVQVALTSTFVMYTLYSSVSSTLPVNGCIKMIDIWLIHGLLNPFMVFMVLVLSKLLSYKSDNKTYQDSRLEDATKGKKYGKWTSEKFEKQPHAGVRFQNACKLIMPVLTTGFVISFFVVAFNNPKGS